MKTKTIWKIHSWLGLLAGIPLIIIAFTGSLLVFKDEINALIAPERVLVEPLQSGKAPLELRLQKLEEAHPGHETAGIAFYDIADRADFVYVVPHNTADWHYVFQNPYTGEVLGEPKATDAEIMGWILELHYTLLAGHTGILVCGIIALLLCALGVSGCFLYRKFWKNFFTFRWKSSARALTGNLHKRVGVLSAPVFLILGLTGAVWNLLHIAEEFTHDHHDEVPPARHHFYNAELSFDSMAEQCRTYIPDFALRYLSLPWEAGVPIRYYGEFTNQSSLRSPYHSTISFDADTGAYMDHQRINDAPFLTQIYDTFTPLHFGTFGGLFTRILWCVLGSAPGFLALSGFFIWRKRK
ncbi:MULTISPECIES: PepSY domain-containing protein [unclassified Lentimonas]|uniref:PepSY-associated TM helix domain-containing protein n=1 Tax=unclassified Lentimonas TaxID=2630993 RepID=UPI00132937A8|nr:MULTISPECIES: PepSY-associated TM helix domain-containing protein [unclassified Lentimonas]CAA6695444.1 Unannotated [Lentimonas sp. CC10]CAA6696617.1 Unannotated [Lentimonas sp. CC19]CAA7071303.1 Unannotated [Lentimonas sp. CC11]